MKHSKTGFVQKYFCIAISTLMLALILPAYTQAASADDPPKIIEISPIMQFPNYRGMVVRGDNTPWKIKLEAHWSSKWTGKTLSIKSTLTDAEGKVLLDNTIEQKPSDNALDISLQPPKDLALGNYKLQMKITEPNSKQFQNNAVIRVVEEMPRVYVDAQGFTVVDGKRFFPMGLYLGGGSNGEDDLKRISEGGFNTILSYSYGNAQKPTKKEYMDLAQKYNLKVVYSLKDLYSKNDDKSMRLQPWTKDIMDVVKDEPAMLAWYTNDELKHDWNPVLKEMYQKVQKLDNHQYPTLMIQNRHYEMKMESPYTDILGFDPYPVGNSPQAKDGTLTISSSWTRKAIDFAAGAKGVWMAPQIMDWAVYQKDGKPKPPTLDEMRNQAYQMIINGATGLIWYSYFDLKWEKYPRDDSTKNMELFHKRWKDVAAMAQEINKIIPVILEDKKVLLELPEKHEVEVAAWKSGNKLSMMLANPYYEEKSITFPLPAGWQIKTANQGQIKSTFVNGKATFTLPSVGSGAFYLEKK